jgi:ABC-type uncharacterized transport system involved in gliding motility auxiliary subunit
MERKQKAATESGVLLLIVAAILVAVNAISAFGVFRRVDTTKAQRFTLSQGSARLLQSMKQSMKVEAYVTRGLPKLDAFTRDLRDLLQEYKTSSGGKFDYEMIEAKDEEQKKAAKDAGLVEQPFGEASATEEKAAVTQGFMGIVFKYGAEKDVIKFLPPERTDGLEFWITNKIREIRDKGDDIKHKIGVLTGHDEIKLSEANLVPSQMGKPSMQQIVSQNFPFYTFQDVDLKNGDNEIDAALDGLIITQPGKDITEKELRRIDQFVMRGKALVVVASSVNLKASDATMNASLTGHGLEKILDGYGIEMKKDVVLDKGRSFRILIPTQGGIGALAVPTMLLIQDDPRFTGNETLLDTSFPAFFRLPELVFPFASSLGTKPEKQPEGKLQIIARSTPRSMALTGDTVDLKPFQRWTQKGKYEQFAVAASIEGKLKPAMAAGDGVERPDMSTGTSRVLVISSAEFFANPFARAGNGPDMGQFGMQFPGAGGDEELLRIAGPYAQQALTPTILAFKNTLDWLTGDTDLLAVSAKILSEPNLAYGEVAKPSFEENESEEQLRKRDEEMKAMRKKQQENIQWALILGIPLLVAAYGLFRWRSRMSARANVSLA